MSSSRAKEKMAVPKVRSIGEASRMEQWHQGDSGPYNADETLQVLANIEKLKKGSSLDEVEETPRLRKLRMIIEQPDKSSWSDTGSTATGPNSPSVSSREERPSSGHRALSLTPHEAGLRQETAKHQQTLTENVSLKLALKFLKQKCEVLETKVKDIGDLEKAISDWEEKCHQERQRNKELDDENQDLKARIHEYEQHSVLPEVARFVASQEARIAELQDELARYRQERDETHDVEETIEGSDVELSSARQKAQGGYLDRDGYQDPDHASFVPQLKVEADERGHQSHRYEESDNESRSDGHGEAVSRPASRPFSQLSRMDSIRDDVSVAAPSIMSDGSLPWNISDRPLFNIAASPGAVVIKEEPGLEAILAGGDMKTSGKEHKNDVPGSDLSGGIAQHEQATGYHNKSGFGRDNYRPLPSIPIDSTAQSSQVPDNESRAQVRGNQPIPSIDQLLDPSQPRHHRRRRTFTHIPTGLDTSAGPQQDEIHDSGDPKFNRQVLPPTPDTLSYGQLTAKNSANTMEPSDSLEVQAKEQADITGQGKSSGKTTLAIPSVLPGDPKQSRSPHRSQVAESFQRHGLVRHQRSVSDLSDAAMSRDSIEARWNKRNPNRFDQQYPDMFASRTRQDHSPLKHFLNRYESSATNPTSTPYGQDLFFSHDDSLPSGSGGPAKRNQVGSKTSAPSLDTYETEKNTPLRPAPSKIVQSPIGSEDTGSPAGRLSQSSPRKLRLANTSLTDGHSGSPLRSRTPSLIITRMRRTSTGSYEPIHDGEDTTHRSNSKEPSERPSVSPLVSSQRGPGQRAVTFDSILHMQEAPRSGSSVASPLSQRRGFKGLFKRPGVGTKSISGPFPPMHARRGHDDEPWHYSPSSPASPSLKKSGSGTFGTKPTSGRGEVKKAQGGIRKTKSYNLEAERSKPVFGSGEDSPVSSVEEPKVVDGVVSLHRMRPTSLVIEDPPIFDDVNEAIASPEDAGSAKRQNLFTKMRKPWGRH